MWHLVEAASACHCLQPLHAMIACDEPCNSNSMSQDQYQVAAFLHECAQRRWRDPPDELVFADCDEPTAAQVEAEALAEVALSESSDYFMTAESDEFYEVYSDEFFDCVDPMSRAGSSRGVQARS